MTYALLSMVRASLDEDVSVQMIHEGLPCLDSEQEKEAISLSSRKMQNMLVRLMCRAGQCTRNVIDWSLIAH